MNDVTRAVMLDPDWFGGVDTGHEDTVDEAGRSTVTIPMRDRS